MHCDLSLDGPIGVIVAQQQRADRITESTDRSRERFDVSWLCNMWIADESIPGEYEQGSLLFRAARGFRVQCR